MDKEEIFYQMLNALESAQIQFEQMESLFEDDEEFQEAFKEVNTAIEAANKLTD